MRRTTVTAALATTLALAAPAARANDSEAAIAVGGLTLVKSADVVMESEDLFVSEARVTVDYVFRNTGAADLETLVAFPLPDVENGIEVPAPDYETQLDFRTTVDGVPTPLKLVQSAHFKGADVSARLTGLGVPLMPVAQRFDRAVNALADDARKALVADGLIEEEGSDGKQTLWAARWTTRTSVTRTQVFPAGRPVEVSHSYKPLAGGSVGGMLEPHLRNDPEFREEVASRARKWCLDDAFLRAYDASNRKNTVRTETWISYVLTSGANWKGPIGSFRMVIDKGDPKSLVSFCGDGVKKISPTRFEITARNFTPTRDVDVLIVKPPIVP